MSAGGEPGHAMQITRSQDLQNSQEQKYNGNNAKLMGCYFVDPAHPLVFYFRNRKHKVHVKEIQFRPLDTENEYHAWISCLYWGVVLLLRHDASVCISYPLHISPDSLSLNNFR